jgi:DNA-binding CsgD family transcriptional regulator
MVVPEHTQPFVGRRAELTALRAELATVRSGRPRVVLLEGPSGIGKTAMLDHFLADESDFTVLRATGEHAVIVVDDAQWADVDSLRALLFVARRLVRERVLLLFAHRVEDAVRLPEGLRRLAASRTGITIRLEPLTTGDIRALAAALGVSELSTRAVQRLAAHTAGNPLYATTLLAEVPEERWRTWEPALPAPRTFAVQMLQRLDACTPEARGLVEAAAVLGVTAPLTSAAALAGVTDLVSALDEAVEVGLLQVGVDDGLRDVSFPHPLTRAAVYDQLGPGRRIGLHGAAAGLVEDEGAALRHRVLAATPPDPALAAELEAFAHRESRTGAWAGAAWTLVEASRLSVNREQREHRLLRAVDAMIGAGDLVQAEAFARQVMSFDVAPLRDATMGYLAVLRGRAGGAGALLRAAWEACDAARDRDVAAVVAQRLALHAVGRLRGDEVVEWAQRALELAGPDDPVRVEAQALLGLGLAWQGRMREGLATYESVLATIPDDVGAQAERVRMAYGWLSLVTDDMETARTTLAQAAAAALRAGSVRIAVWSFVWLSRAEFAVGAWDEAAAAERAVSLLEESGHEWLRPLARLVAVTVLAARGEWVAAQEHAAAASAGRGDYALMVVSAGVARALVPAARGDHDGVLRALAPVVGLSEREGREGVDEPGFWPWQDVYADALVSAGRLAEAEEFLVPHEQRAAARGRGSMVAKLARVRGRLEAARGRLSAAEAALGRAAGELERVGLPFERALVDLVHGQVLRRAGRRRAAAERLSAARERLAGLRARPFLERCEQELAACGLAPAKRSDFDPSRLTAQELAVARLVAVGMSNRQVASELFISIKTVQFHLTHIYAKLGVSSRAELAAQFRDPEPTNGRTPNQR